MLLKKKIICLIPARGGSKGIKLKNLKKINGKSLLKLTCEFAKKTTIFDKIIVSTENSKIKKEAQVCKVETIHRPDRLSKDFVTDYQVINHVLKKFNFKYDYLVYLQPTSPIRSKNFFIKYFKKTIKGNYDSCWSVNEVDNKFHPLKILEIKNNKFKLFSDKGKKFVARQLLSKIFIRNGNFYIFKVLSLQKNKSIYLKKNLPAVTNYKTVNIDTQKDLINSRKLLGLR